MDRISRRLHYCTLFHSNSDYLIVSCVEDDTIVMYKLSSSALPPPQVGQSNLG